MAKRIKLTDAIAVEFGQRAAGQETPCWLGTIWDVSGQKAIAVGDFGNDGRGGPTLVRLFAIAAADRGAIVPDRDAIVRMGEAAFSDLGVQPFEPDGAVIGWAEMIGYALKCGCEDFTLQDYIDLLWGGSDLPDRTAEQRLRGTAASSKAARVEQAAAAKRAANRGETIVRVGDGADDQYHTFRTRDMDAIRRRFAGREIEILA